MKNDDKTIIFLLIFGIVGMITIATIIIITTDEFNIFDNLNKKEEIIEKNIGDELICKDYTAIIESFKYKTGGIDSFFKIPDNEEWIGLIVSVKNTTNSKVSINSSDFNVINSNGQILKPNVLTYKIWDTECLCSPQLAENGTKKGYIVFTNGNTDNSNIIVELKCNRNSLFTTDNIYNIKLK